MLVVIVLASVSMVIVYALGIEWEAIKINQVADRSVNMGVDQEENMVSHIIPPNYQIPLLRTCEEWLLREFSWFFFSFLV